MHRQALPCQQIRKPTIHKNVESQVKLKSEDRSAFAKMKRNIEAGLDKFVIEVMTILHDLVTDMFAQVMDEIHDSCKKNKLEDLNKSIFIALPKKPYVAKQTPLNN